MKIAIPLFKDRVAPHFGASSEILLVEVRGGVLYQEAKWDMGNQTPLEMARHLISFGVDKIIFGGINRFYKEWLIKKGVSVEDNRTGEVNMIIERMLSN